MGYEASFSLSCKYQNSANSGTLHSGVRQGGSHRAGQRRSSPPFRLGNGLRVGTLSGKGQIAIILVFTGYVQSLTCFSLLLCVLFCFLKKPFRNVTAILSSRAVQNPTPGWFWKVASPTEALKAGLLCSLGLPPGPLACLQCSGSLSVRAGLGFVFLLMLRERSVSELFRLQMRQLQQSQMIKACSPGGQDVGFSPPPQPLGPLRLCPGKQERVPAPCPSAASTSRWAMSEGSPRK